MTDTDVSRVFAATPGETTSMSSRTLGWRPPERTIYNIDQWVLGGWEREWWGLGLVRQDADDPLFTEGTTRADWELLARTSVEQEALTASGYDSFRYFRWFPDDPNATGLDDYYSFYAGVGSVTGEASFGSYPYPAFDHRVTEASPTAAPSLGIRKPVPEGSFTGIRRRNISIAFPHSPDLFSPESGIAGAPTNLLERPTDIDLVEPDPREITTTSGSTRGTPRVGL